MFWSLAAFVQQQTLKQVFTVRRIIGESMLDRNEGLWREVDALEDILREAHVRHY